MKCLNCGLGVERHSNWPSVRIIIDSNTERQHICANTTAVNYSNNTYSNTNKIVQYGIWKGYTYKESVEMKEMKKRQYEEHMKHLKLIKEMFKSPYEKIEQDNDNNKSNNIHKK